MAMVFKTVSFVGSVPLRDEIVFVSARISTPFRMTRIVSTFALGQNNLVQLSFFIATDPDAPSSGIPSGNSVLKDYGQVDYVVGEDTQLDMSHSVREVQAGAWLKVRAVNADFFEHAVNVQMTIEING